MMLLVRALLHGLLCHEEFNQMNDTMLVGILHLNSTIHYAFHAYHEENLIRVLVCVCMCVYTVWLCVEDD